MTKQAKNRKVVEPAKEDCESCKFNITMDDEKMRCEFAKMLGKREPGCEKFEGKA
jgi:hypothetical protein